MGEQLVLLAAWVLCKRFLMTTGKYKNVLFIFGGGTIQFARNGKLKSPQVSLVKEIKKNHDVILLQERFSSRLCHLCHKSVAVQVARTRYSAGQSKGKLQPSSVLKAAKGKLQRCRNPQCTVTVMQRDQNSALNILVLFDHYRRTGNRIHAFNFENFARN